MTEQFKALPLITKEQCYELFKRGNFQTSSVLFSRKIDIKALTYVSHAQKYCVISLPSKGFCLVYHFGTIVLFNCLDDEKQTLYHFLKPFADIPFERKEIESMSVEITPNQPNKVSHDKICIQDCTPEFIEVIADVLSKTIKMDQFEQTVAESFAKVEPIAVHLKSKGKLEHSSVQLLRHIGDSLLTEHEITGRIEMNDKPNVLWEHPDLEPLYHQLMDEFEVLERIEILDKKIELIARTAQTSLEVLQHRHASRLEWYIIILIIVSICLEIYALISH